MNIMKHFGKRGFALLLALVMCLGLLPMTAFADTAEPGYVPETTAQNTVPDADTAEPGYVPETTTQNTVPDVAELQNTPVYATLDELRAAFAAAQEALEAGVETGDIQGAVAAMDAYLAVYARLSPEDQAANAGAYQYVQGYRDQLAAGLPDPEVDPMALLVGEKFQIRVNIGYLDGGSFHMVESKMVVSTCQDSNGHAGHNHTMDANDILTRAGYPNADYRVTSTGTFSSPESTIDVDYNITGSAPYKADQTFWIFSDSLKPNVDNTPGGSGNGGGNNGGGSISTGGKGTYSWTEYVVYHANYPGELDPQFELTIYATGTFGNMTIAANQNHKSFSSCGFSVPEGYTLMSGWYSAPTGDDTVGQLISPKWENRGKTTHVYAHYTANGPQTNTISMTYNANGGTVNGQASYTDQRVTTDKSQTFNGIEPVWDGHIFDGWYTAANGGTKVPFPKTLTVADNSTEASQTVFAHWHVIPDDPANVIYLPGEGGNGGNSYTPTGNQPYTVLSPNAVGISGPADKVFSHWSVTVEGQDGVNTLGSYFGGDKITPAAKSTWTFTAVWKDDDSQTGDAIYNVQWFKADGTLIKSEPRQGTTGSPVSIREADKVLAGYIYDEGNTGNLPQAILAKSGTVLKLYFRADPSLVDNGAGITVAKTPNVRTATVGDTVTWTITVTNESNVVKTVTVADQLTGVTLSPADGVVTLNPKGQSGSTGTVIASLLLTDAHVGKPLVNTVTASTGKSGEQKTAKSDPITVKAEVVDDGKGISITKTPNVTTATVGDTVTWTVTVTNKSNVTKTVSLSEELTGAALAPSSVTLEKGASTTLTATYTVKEADAGKALHNVVIGTTTNTTTGATETARGETTDGIQIDALQPNIVVTKTVSSDAPKPGDSVTYTITVKNTGTAKATNVVVADVLDSSLTYVSHTGDATSKVEDNYPIGDLDVNQTKTVKITATVSKTAKVGSTIVNTAAAGWDQKDQSGKNPDGTDPEGKVTITVSEKLYTVTFCANGGVFKGGAYGPGEHYNVPVPAGKALKDVTGFFTPEEKDVSRDKYTFNGWQDFDDSTLAAPVTKDVTYYADWTPIPGTQSVKYSHYFTKDGLSGDGTVTTVSTITNTGIEQVGIQILEVLDPNLTLAGYENTLSISGTVAQSELNKLLRADKTDAYQNPVMGHNRQTEAFGIGSTDFKFGPGESITIVYKSKLKADSTATKVTNWLFYWIGKDGFTESDPRSTMATGGEITIGGAAAASVSMDSQEPAFGAATTESFGNSVLMARTVTTRRAFAMSPTFAFDFNRPTGGGASADLEIENPNTPTDPSEPGKDDPGKDDPGKDEPGKDEPGKDEPGKDEPGKDEPGKDEPNTPDTPDNPNTPDNPSNPSIPDDPYYPVWPDTPTPTPAPSNPSGETVIDETDVPLASAIGLNDTDHMAYIIGYEDGTVRPENKITRAEVATIFFRLMTDTYRTINWSTTNDFSDVDAGKWYNNAISTCANAELVLGHNGKFRPNDNITRAEFATIAFRMLDGEYTGEGVELPADCKGHWAADAIRCVIEAGWFTGDNGDFRPNDFISRAEAMTVINRMLHRVPDKEHMLPEMKTWIDNPETKWYYEAVQEATNEHDYEWIKENVENWTELLTVRDWAALEKEWADANSD